MSAPDTPKIPPAPPLPVLHRDGTRTWNGRDLAAQLAWFAAAAAGLRKVSATVIRRACADVDDGTGSSGRVPVSGGGVADDGSENGSVPAVVLGRFRFGGWVEDPVARAMSELAGGVVAAHEGLRRAVDAAAELHGLSAVEAAELRALIGRGGRQAAHCEVCARWVPGTVVDRLRAGRCEACYRWRLKHDGVDRPRERWGRDDEEDAGWRGTTTQASDLR